MKLYQRIKYENRGISDIYLNRTLNRIIILVLINCLGSLIRNRVEHSYSLSRDLCASKSDSRLLNGF